MPKECPKLRPVEVSPLEVQGQMVVCLRDPSGFVEEPVCVRPEDYFIISFFDGEHTALDIQAAYMRQFGQLLMSERVERIAQELAELHLMEGERFDAFKAEAERLIAA